jgi:hypothetical protein
MHLVANPAAELARLQDKAELEKLREENTSLKQALTARSAAAAASGAAGVPQWCTYCYVMRLAAA